MNLFLLLLALLSAPQQGAKFPPADSLLAQGTKIPLPNMLVAIMYQWANKDTLLIWGIARKRPHDRLIYLMNVKTLKIKQVQTGIIRGRYPLMSIALSPDKTKLALLTEDALRVIDMVSGKKIQEWRITKQKKFIDRLQCLWLSDNRQIAVNYFLFPSKNPNMLYVYSLQNKKALRSISLLKNTPFRYGRERILDVTKDNRLLCLYEKPYWDGFFFFGTHFAVDMEHPQRIQMRTPTFPNKWECKSVALSPDKTHLLWQVGLPLGSSSESDYILVSDLEMKHFEEIGTLPINTGELRWNPDGKHFSIKSKNDLWIIPLSKEQ